MLKVKDRQQEVWPVLLAAQYIRDYHFPLEFPYMFYTVNVEIFALCIYSRNSRFLDMCETIYNVKNIFIIAQRAKKNENANFNPSEIAHFVKSAKIYTCENIYVYSIPLASPLMTYLLI